MALGPLSEDALLAAGIAAELIDELRRGESRWQIALASTAGFGASEHAARAQSDLKRSLKLFEVVIEQTEATREGTDRKLWRKPFKQLVATDVGQRIARAKEYEEALEQRGEAKSVLFAAGNLDDWGQVASTSTWSVLAYDFQQAARIVAASHTREEPAPTLALLQLCRHSLELEMKTIIDAGRRLLGDAKPVHPTHGLMNCWRDAFPFIERWWNRDVWTDEAAERVREIVSSFDEIDATAMETRYPVNKEGQPFERPATLLNFSIKTMMAEYEHALQFFFSAHLFIEVQRKIEEMEHEFAAKAQAATSSADNPIDDEVELDE